MDKFFILIATAVNCLTISTKAQNLVTIETVEIEYPLPFIHDFVISEDKFFLGAFDGLYQTNTETKTVQRTYGKRKGYSHDGQYIFSIDSLGRVFQSDEILLSLANELMKNRTSVLLAKSRNKFFTCIIDPYKLSYSNGIYYFNEQGHSLFTYLVGIPSGLFADENYLWYLYQRSKPNDYGLLRKYHIQTGEMLLEMEVPVIEPVGLTVRADSITTFSNQNRTFYILKLKED